MTLSNEQDFCVQMSFPPSKKGLKLFLEKYGCLEMSKINIFKPESHCIHTKYIGAKRLLLTPPIIAETFA